MFIIIFGTDGVLIKFIIKSDVVFVEVVITFLNNCFQFQSYVFFTHKFCIKECELTFSISSISWRVCSLIKIKSKDKFSLIHGNT